MTVPPTRLPIAGPIAVKADTSTQGPTARGERDAAFRLCAAPMMDYTDRHLRRLFRLFAPQARLYTEMVTAAAIEHGHADRVAQLLAFSAAEPPVALQLGGADPDALAAAARRGARLGYQEINLNVGCPSPRVVSGRFGACLMAEPTLVAQCVSAMRRAVDVPVTVKCRLGTDDEDSQTALEHFAEQMIDAGVAALIVHARIAVLNGLSPKQNREIPPLQYERVYALKTRFPETPIVLNGGLSDAAACTAALAHCDGVMLGRAVCQRPALLGELNALLFGGTAIDEATALTEYAQYARRQLLEGATPARMIRPILGLFAGRSGSRAFRRVLTLGGQQMARQGQRAEWPDAWSTLVTRAQAELAPAADTRSAVAR